MKYSCNYCNDQACPCIAEVTGVDMEPPYSCIYANIEADWKEMKESDYFEMRGFGKTQIEGKKMNVETCSCDCDNCSDRLGQERLFADDNKSKRGKILMQALEIINGDRQDTYGKPEDSFALIAEYWNSYLISLQKNILEKNGFNPKEYKLVNMLDCKGVAEMMMLFKIARMSGQKPNLDNYLDLVGYAGIAADMVQEDRK